jgi:predicted RNA-binding protein associated with RNAse of E/G family
VRQALLRHVFRGHISMALPVTVVEETDQRVVLFLRAGTPVRMLDPYGGLPIWIEGGYRTIARPWLHNHFLMIVPKGRAHAVYMRWEASTGNEIGWYVNLQEPLRPTRLGWDTCDQELDVEAWPDLSAWWWKDEDRFAERVELGLLSEDEARAVWAEGEAVIADLEARRRPFDEPWRDWRPDPTWPLPTLPDDWHVLD